MKDRKNNEIPSEEIYIRMMKSSNISDALWEQYKSEEGFDEILEDCVKAFPTLSEREAYDMYQRFLELRHGKEDYLRDKVQFVTKLTPFQQRERERNGHDPYIDMLPYEEDLKRFNKIVENMKARDAAALNEPEEEEEQNVPENNNEDDNNDETNDSSNNWKWIVMFAIFLLGIGGCFGGLIMKKSKDASETATSTYSQNKENNNKQIVEVKMSNPIEKDTSGSNDVEYLISRIDIYLDDPEEVESVKAPKPNFKKLYKGEKKEEILEEKDLPNHKDPKFDGKLFVRYKGFLYKKTPPKHSPHEDTGEIDWYKELETFFTDKKEFYNTTFKKMGGEYCEAVKAIQATDIGVVPYHHVAEKDAKDLTITAQVNMLDVDYEYRSRLDEIAMLRKMFYMYRYLLIDQSGHEENINGVNPYDPKYRNIETYSGCQYKDTYWNQSGPRYNLRTFDPSYMNDFVKDILRKYK